MNEVYRHGDVVWLELSFMGGTKFTSGKSRPGLLVRPNDDLSWVVILFTTQPRYKSTRQMRVPVFASRRNGLPCHGYLWSPSFSMIVEGQIGRRIGVVDEHLAEVVACNTNVCELDSRRLRARARDRGASAA